MSTHRACREDEDRLYFVFMIHSATEEFVPPRFEGPFDLQRCLELVPPRARVKGVFFQSLDLGSSPRDAGERTRRMAFADYPMMDFMSECVAVANKRFPDVPTKQALRRLGWAAFPSFAYTLIGRVIFGPLGMDLDAVFSAGPKAYTIAIDPIEVSATQLSSCHWRYDYRNAFVFLDSFQVGVIEGAVRHYGFASDIRIRLGSPCEGTFDIRWR